MAKNNSKYLETSYKNDTKQDGNKGRMILNDRMPGITGATSDIALQDAYMNSDLYKLALHGSNFFQKDEIDLYNNIYRFGLYNPYGAVTNLREYLFFTKPDLNILARDDLTGSFITNKSNGTKNGSKVSNSLSSGLANLPFWTELLQERKDTLKMLQNSYAPGWNMLLQNSVISNLEIPDLEGTAIESPVNSYGVGFQYRGTSESSDDSFDFALEFKDTKWLDIYYFFRAYEDYETLKHHGTVAPWQGYIINKILHDQFCIYKFMVGEDMETIVYWCKLYGVMPMGLPRSAFSTADFSNGLSYTINFKAAFFEDMRKEILIEFNNLASEFCSDTKANSYYQYETYNTSTGMGDYRPAKYAYVEQYRNDDSPTGWVYKLKWKGDKKF